MSRKCHQKWVPFGAQNEIASLRHFLPMGHLSCFFLVCFVRAFGGLWVLLGRLLGFLRVSWEVSGPKNIKNPWVFLRFFKGSCWLFKANDGPLGLILVSLVNLFKVLCKKAGPNCVSIWRFIDSIF